MYGSHPLNTSPPRLFDKQELLGDSDEDFTDCVGAKGYHSFSALIDFGTCLTDCTSITNTSTLAEVQQYSWCTCVAMFETEVWGAVIGHPLCNSRVLVMRERVCARGLVSKDEASSAASSGALSHPRHV